MCGVLCSWLVRLIWVDQLERLNKFGRSDCPGRPLRSKYTPLWDLVYLSKAVSQGGLIDLGEVGIPNNSLVSGNVASKSDGWRNLVYLAYLQPEWYHWPKPAGLPERYAGLILPSRFESYAVLISGVLS